MRHQSDGVEFLISRRRGLLAFEQGLGKTLVAIEAFRRLLQDGALQRLFVVCPNSLKRNWVAEIERFAPGLATVLIEGSPRRRREVLDTSRAPVTIMSYETARSETMSVVAVMKRSRSALVLDESHFVKNRESLSTIAARNLAEAAEFRWLLSGTPVTNSPDDLFSQIAILGADREFQSFAAFKAMYGDVSTDRDRSALSQRVSHYLMRRTKDECLDLPEKTFVDVEVELPSWQRALYDAMRDRVVREVESMSHDEFAAFAPTALTRVLRLAQLASNPSLLLPTESRTPGKVAELDVLLSELLDGTDHKVIVWTYYVGTLEKLLTRYRSYGAVALYGAVPNEERQSVARAFQEDRSVRLLIANPAAAGTGFTFTSATYAIYETLSWRFDHYAQSQDRNHRIGQDRPVTYLRLLAADTIDTALVESLSRKSQLARSLVGDEDTIPPVAEMSREEFLTMVKQGTLPGRG
jgi:SNF2 family DNA or RNA helicase